jgi:two-component system response regulator YesN
MYKVVLVEDEPAAAENIRDIIRLYCPQFEVAAEGDNGQAGLELARRHKPDLLLTDIRMPVMDGLELIARLHEEAPLIKTVILSGYQDFEYARTALQHGAADYLLKPISPQSLKPALEQLIPAINDAIAQERLPLLRGLLNGGLPDWPRVKSHFTAPAYTLALSRKNGLPGRYCRAVAAGPHGVIDGETADIYGRDDMECLRLAPGFSAFTGKSLEGINRLHRDIPGYTTTVVRNRPFPLEELPLVIKTLYRVLDSHVTIGRSQVIAADANPFARGGQPDFELKQLSAYCVKEHKPERVRSLLLERLSKWEAEGRTQLYVEGSVRAAFEELSRFTGRETELSRDEGLEFMIDDAFFYAASYAELGESLLFILEKFLPDAQNPTGKVDTPEFFELIRQYLGLHLTETLSLQALCKHFGVSQTYMSRLFRKYTGLSFTNYFTSRRIEKAKEHLSTKGILAKDAAAMAGFNDYFYFSRVFRAFTGQSPSEWLRLNTGL